MYDWDPNCLHYWGIVVYSVYCASQLFTLLGYCCIQCILCISVVYITWVLLYTVYTVYPNCLYYWGIVVYSVYCASQLFTLLGYCCIQCILCISIVYITWVLLYTVYTVHPNCLHYWGIVVYSVYRVSHMFTLLGYCCIQCIL